MKRSMIFVIMLITILSLSSLSFAEEVDGKSSWTGNVNFILGGKAVDKDDWKPVEDHGEFGVSLDIMKKSWPFSLALESLGSAGEDKIAGSDVRLRTHELNIGIKKIITSTGKTRPFIGGGVSFISAEASPQLFGLNPSGPGVTYTMQGSGTGLWAGAGIYWTLEESFNVGFEAKISAAKAKFDGISDKKQVGGGHFGLILGYHW